MYSTAYLRRWRRRAILVETAITDIAPMTHYVAIRRLYPGIITERIRIERARLATKSEGASSNVVGLMMSGLA
jgi:hypothetical protein